MNYPRLETADEEAKGTIIKAVEEPAARALVAVVRALLSL